MYSSIFLLAIAQMFLVSNWIAGPALFTAFSIMFGSRLHTEERMMLDKFGAQYESYRLRTKRIIPEFGDRGTVHFRASSTARDLSDVDAFVSF